MSLCRTHVLKPFGFISVFSQCTCAKKKRSLVRKVVPAQVYLLIKFEGQLVDQFLASSLRVCVVKPYMICTIYSIFLHSCHTVPSHIIWLSHVIGLLDVAEIDLSHVTSDITIGGFSLWIT